MNKKQRFSNVKGLFQFLKPYRVSFFLGIICIIAVTVINAITPRAEGLITTRLTQDVMNMANGIQGAGVHFDYVLKIMVLLAGLYLLNTVFAFAYNFLLTNSIQNTMRDLRHAVEGKIRRLPIRYFDKNTFGDVLSRVTNDVDTISNAMQQGVANFINAALTLTLALVMMYTLNIKMAAVATLIIPISFLISRFIIKHSQRIFLKQQNALGKLNGTVEELYTGYNEIMLFGKQEASIQEFKRVNSELCHSGFWAQFISSLMSPLVSFVTYLGIGSIALMGAFHVIAGRLTVGNLQAFVRYIWQINQPLSQATQLSAAAQSAYAAISRVFEFLNESEEVPDPIQSKKIEKLRGEVTFEHVKFGYQQDKILINDLNAEVKSGQMVAIVGPTGAGKTTLINLLMRFYDVLDGSIKIDGIDIRAMKRKDLRSLLGMVLQDTWLFHGTIYENIKYGRLDAARDEVVAAAKLANVHHFIKTLPDGYDMVLNEEASNISQGEKQLLTIARVLLADPPILILDEATSSVDTRLEVLLQKAMRNIMKGRTSFVIAHRLSTIRNADLILVMNHGSIIEQGTHKELMAKNGFYEKLYNSQFANKGK